MAARFDSERRELRYSQVSRGAIIMTSFTQTPVLADVDVLHAFAEEVRRRNRRVAIITQVATGAKMPDAPTRARAAELQKAATVSGIDVVVLTGGGLWSTAARAVLTGIYLVSGKLSENRVAVDVDEAVRIVAAELPTDLEQLKKMASDFQAWLATKAP